MNMLLPAHRYGSWHFKDAETMESRCCGNEVHVEGSVTQYYVCNNCGFPCQLRVKKEENKDENDNERARD